MGSFDIRVWVSERMALEYLRENSKMNIGINDKITLQSGGQTVHAIVTSVSTPPPERTYRIGDRFRRQVSDSTYMLVSCEHNKVVMINLQEGSRYGNPIQIRSPEFITVDELTSQINNFRDCWSYLTSERTR